MVQTPHPKARERFAPFLQELMDRHGASVHSVHLVGSALTPDFDPKRSDVNSVVVLHRLSLAVLGDLAPLGRRFGAKGVAVPWVMTPEYVRDSLDVFPVEFLTISRLHQTLAGDDLFAGIRVAKADLRAQCEREIKARWIGLARAYVGAAGKAAVLARDLMASFPGYPPLFRGILHLLDRDLPAAHAEVIRGLEQAAEVDLGAFLRILEIRRSGRRPRLEDLTAVVERAYPALERLGTLVDAIPV